MPPKSHYFKMIFCIVFICIGIFPYDRLSKEKDMKILEFLQRQKDLLTHFRLGKNGNLEGSPVRVETFDFESPELLSSFSKPDPDLCRDVKIAENRSFCYPVFVPPGELKSTSGILLLHGLNERNWDKYLCWAEYLAIHTQKPVILFPLAFHINRSPSSWCDPRSMSSLMVKRKQEAGDPRSLTFANAALSERLSKEPYRFFSSGLQTVQDLMTLTLQIRNGEHPLFSEGASLDIFAYSIGSFLAEIILMANPLKLFSTTRLFVFCGGAIFCDMYGESRYIMDKTAYERLFQYYCYDWLREEYKTVTSGEAVFDGLLSAFNTMINPDLFKKERTTFFESGKERIAGISLVKDKVMPWSGVEACMGSRLAGECFELMDFPYDYTHESPFPTNGRIDNSSLNYSFLTVFQKSAAFLA